jgi:hypothetical protein
MVLLSIEVQLAGQRDARVYTAGETAVLTRTLRGAREEPIRVKV